MYGVFDIKIHISLKMYNLKLSRVMRKPENCLCKGADQLCSTEWFMSDLVGNPENWFSRVASQFQMMGSTVSQASW